LNGKISKEEFSEAYKKLYPKKAPADLELELDMIWVKLDVDGNGEIDYTEWALGTAAPKDTVLSEKKLKQAFSLFD
jgi:Ca2+-binding EF-hand superfamily protein